MTAAVVDGPEDGAGPTGAATAGAAASAVATSAPVVSAAPTRRARGERDGICMRLQLTALSIWVTNRRLLASCVQKQS
ncbi:hypothetical protein IU11_10835 [Cellulosimicrobium sp. MM]|nr:hypothetical protein IU11_10835 [Cellulosimicrobium sp. MM]